MKPWIEIFRLFCT